MEVLSQAKPEIDPRIDFRSDIRVCFDRLLGRLRLTQSGRAPDSQLLLSALMAGHPHSAHVRPPMARRIHFVSLSAIESRAERAGSTVSRVLRHGGLRAGDLDDTPWTGRKSYFQTVSWKPVQVVLFVLEVCVFLDQWQGLRELTFGGSPH